jgi:hypothetical protein
MSSLLPSLAVVAETPDKVTWFWIGATPSAVPLPARVVNRWPAGTSTDYQRFFYSISISLPERVVSSIIG